jgi:hypothetical protein
VSLDLVLWAVLVRHLVLLLGLALDARFLNHKTALTGEIFPAPLSFGKSR